ICNPLRYPIIMTPRVCMQMATGSWAGGVLISLMHTIYAMHFFTCCSRKTDHFFCEIMALLKLSCEDTSIYEKVVLLSSIAFLLIPFGLILTSYIYIYLTVLRMNSPEGKNKALATCSSHLCVVSLYFGPAMIIYMTPGSSLPSEMDQHLFVFDVIIIPMLNPLIYSLRNKEVLGALRKALWRKLMLSREDDVTCTLKHSDSFFFFLKIFYYLFMRDTERDRDTGRGSSRLHAEARCRTQSQNFGIMS
uniref:G-protein coupled receptors family 1 profile domain-containing protein n=2 Tax=Canis lupus familiaris TaxID=9615 RepID=A0A8C0T4D1_CANLF